MFRDPVFLMVRSMVRTPLRTACEPSIFSCLRTTANHPRTACEPLRTNLRTMTANHVCVCVYRHTQRFAVATVTIWRCARSMPGRRERCDAHTGWSRTSLSSERREALIRAEASTTSAMRRRATPLHPRNTTPWLYRVAVNTTGGCIARSDHRAIKHWGDIGAIFLPVWRRIFSTKPGTRRAPLSPNQTHRPDSSPKNQPPGAAHPYLHRLTSRP